MKLPDWSTLTPSPSPLSVAGAAFALAPSVTFHAPDLSLASVEIDGATVWIRRVRGQTTVFHPKTETRKAILS